MDTIIKSMGRTLFVCAWADREEENGGGASMGADYMDLAPETPQEATQQAYRLAGAIEQANGACMAVLFHQVALGAFDCTGANATDEQRDTFGHYLVMEALGHGVSWEDDHPPHGLKVPYWEGLELPEAAPAPKGAPGAPRVYTCPKCTAQATVELWDDATRKDFGGPVVTLADALGHEHTCPQCNSTSTAEDVALAQLPSPAMVLDAVIVPTVLVMVTGGCVSGVVTDSGAPVRVLVADRDNYADAAAVAPDGEQACTLEDWGQPEEGPLTIEAYIAALDTE